MELPDQADLVLLGREEQCPLLSSNTGSSLAEVQLTLHTGTGEHTLSDTIEAGEQAVFEDIVGLMGVEAKGALEIYSTQPLEVISRIYNQAPSGTYGQFMDGHTTQDGLYQGQSARLLGLRQMDGLFRTNISVTNTGTAAASVTITLYATAGTQLTEYTLSVDPGRVLQDLKPFESRAGHANVGWGFATVRVNSGSGILTSASVVDSVTGDATTIPMKRY